MVFICGVRCPLWVHQADGGAGASISLKARHWSIIHPGNRGEDAFVHLFSQCVSHLSDTGIPDNDVILIYMRSEMAPMKDPSIAHHHTSPAAAFCAQGWRQARLRQRGKGQGEMLFTALEPERRGQNPGHKPIPLHKHRDI